MKIIQPCIFCVLSFLLTNNVYSQSLGIDFGSGVYNTTINFDPAVGHRGVPNPQNFLINISYPIHSKVDILIAGGYGTGHYSNKYESEIMENNNFTNDVHLSGFLQESEILFNNKISDNSLIRIFGGIGIGYYNYHYKSELSKDSDYLRKAKIKGLSQYFAFGIKFHLNNKIEPYLKLKKMGYSNLKIIDPPPYSNDETTLTAAITPSNGLNDVGISFGIQYKIGK